ncbi:MAG: glycosyltransferase family 39 protein [Planctomycetota bacterium]|nr:glycosyltransferase family 39 protein [Planctomycetota bacterium]
MDRFKDLLLITAIAGSVFFFNLGSAKLWDRDEPRNAGCAREMMERGNYVTPIFNDELRDAKPVLLYWLMISAYHWFGVSEYSARFWSALLALGTVFCTYFLAQRFFNRQVAVFAAVILSTSLMFDVAARAATPDSILIFFNTAALAVFVAFAFPKQLEAKGASMPGFPDHRLMAVGMYGLMAFGVLAKGPIGFLMPTAIIGMYLLIVTADRTELRPVEGVLGKIQQFWLNGLRVVHPLHFLKTCWSMKLMTAIIMILAIAGPWYYLVGQQTNGEFLTTFFFKEHLGRSTTSFENHSGGIWYYPAVMSVGFFPWSVFALPVGVSIFCCRRNLPPSLVLLFCWVGVQVGVFTVVQTKLPSYVTPCYPALAIVVGYFLYSWINGEVAIGSWLPRISFGTLGVSGLLIGAGLGYASVKVLDVTYVVSLIGLIPLVAGFIAFALWQVNASQWYRTQAIYLLFGSAVCFSILFFGFLLPYVSRSQEYQQLFVHADRLQNDSPLGSFGCLEPTWVFYGKQPIYELNEDSQCTDRIGDRRESWKPKSRPPLKQFLIEEQGQVITLAKLVPEIESMIGQPLRIIHRVSYFLKQEELVLVQIESQVTAAQEASRNWK